MLFFELFPVLIALLSLTVAVALFLANRRAAGEPPPPEQRSARGAAPADRALPTSQRSSVRPSMRA